jgi:hypothetical protein
MSWTISGTYVAGCSCAVLCCCPYDGRPRDTKGGTECLGTAVFHVADGNLDDVDLPGVDFAFNNHFPSNLTSGNWKVGLVVDTSASDEQANALENILSGREGGPFGQLSQFYGEYLGMERAKVSLTDGERPGLTVEGRTELSYNRSPAPTAAPRRSRTPCSGSRPNSRSARPPDVPMLSG